jgi:hypothetical protein
MNRLCAAVTVLCVVLILSPPTRAERPLVAVLDFSEISSGLKPHEVELLGDVARGQALATLGTAYNIITRENLVDLLKAHGKNLEQCQGECETETGRLIGADYVVSGRIVKAFGAYKVNLKVHRTSPPELLGAQIGTAPSHAELESAVRKGTHAVLSLLAGKTAAPRPVAPAAKPATQAPPTQRVAPAAPPAPVAEKAAVAAKKVESGMHLLVDLGGFVFVGPTLLLEIGGKTRWTAWYRLIPMGLLSSMAFIDPSEESYETAFGVGTGIRWYGKNNPGLDGVFYGVGAEYVSTVVRNSYYTDKCKPTMLLDATCEGIYEEESVFPLGLIGYRWGSDTWVNQMSVGIGVNVSLKHKVPDTEEAKADDAGPTSMYFVASYEIGIF